MNKDEFEDFVIDWFVKYREGRCLMNEAVEAIVSAYVAIALR